MRNSSLVERDCADNITGLSWTPKLGNAEKRLVGERSGSGEGDLVRIVGATGSANAVMSSEKHVRNMFAERLRFPTEGLSASG